MHRIDTPSRQKDKFGAGKDGFTQGDPQTGTQATQVSAVFLDAIQEEIASVIEDSGVALDKTKNNQLLTAIKSFFKQASESVLGVLKIASQAQTNAGAADDVAITPKKMRAGFSASLTAQGYVAFPTWMGGWIIQWGTVLGSSSGAVTYSFPIAFPSECIGIVGSLAKTSGSARGAAEVVSASQYKVSALLAPSTYYSDPICWIAIGK